MLHLTSWMTTLPIMVIGMVSIVLVIGVIVLAVMFLNKLTSRKPKRREQENERLMHSRSFGSSQTFKAWNSVSAVQMSRFLEVYLGRVA